MVTTFNFAGDAKKLEFHYDESGTMEVSGQTPNYAKGTNALDPHTVVGGAHTLAPNRYFGVDQDKGIAINIDPAGVPVLFRGAGGFRIDLKTYTVVAWCKGADQENEVKSPKYQIAGGAKVTLSDTSTQWPTVIPDPELKRTEIEKAVPPSA